MSDADLFASSDSGSEPLAARMRPRTLDEFVGQEHILGEGRLLRRAIQADMISSLIFYGPPGTGKTTLARVIANTTKSRFVSLNAVLAGVKDVREEIAKARENHELYGRRTILFVDEVHRWNKAQQDALLPWVENGTVVLIGATTQNPFFEVNSALVSRSRIFQLKTLSADDLRRVARRALDDPHRGYGAYDVTIDEDALEHLVSVADGDARALLGALQLAVETTPDRFPPEPGTTIHIDREIAEDSIQQKAVLYDKEGDYHFDVISAFIKSIRGSDPDATLYWMAKMVHSGEAPHYIFRRMLISASEDIGLADPGALAVVESAAAAFDRVGLPEGNFHLAQAALYLATAPKSNSALGYFDALEAVAKESQQEVPNHLRDANRDKEGFGHGEGYLYPHAYRDHWVAQAYLPQSLQGRVFYEPSDQGYEADVAVRVARNRELQLELAIPEETEEILSFSPAADRRLAEWVRRAVEQRMEATAEVRDRTIEALDVRRSDRVFVTGRAATLHLWELVRAAPEGRVVAVVPDARRAETARHYAHKLPQIERPLVLEEDPARALAIDGVREHRYERLLLADALAERSARSALPAGLATLSVPAARLVVVQRLPAHGQRISELAGGHPALDEAEAALFSDPANELVNWDSRDLEGSLVGAGWTLESSGLIETRETRHLSREQIDRWLDPDRAAGLGAALAAQSKAARESAEGLLRARLAGKTVEWKTVSALIVATRRDPTEQAGA
ncbi:MAG: AAA family ATPase [Spirochaetota bacterium]